MHINPFASSDQYPHHISVGVILINDQNQFACHYYADSQIRGYPKNFYTLLHETIESGETIAETVARGLCEEYSMTGTFERYVGAIVTRTDLSVWAERTVIYFMSRLISVEPRDTSDPESQSEIVWMDCDELIGVMKTQGADDESKILEDVKKYYL